MPEEFRHTLALSQTHASRRSWKKKTVQLHWKSYLLILVSFFSSFILSYLWVIAAWTLIFRWTASFYIFWFSSFLLSASPSGVLSHFCLSYLFGICLNQKMRINKRKRKTTNRRRVHNWTLAWAIHLRCLLFPLRKLACYFFVRFRFFFFFNLNRHCVITEKVLVANFVWYIIKSSAVVDWEL